MRFSVLLASTMLLAACGDGVNEKDLTAEQWREILLNDKHAHLALSEGSMDAIIAWLMSK